MDETHHNALCRQLLALHTEEKYTDFKVVPADGDPIPCHKVVMAAMSPFFDVMLNNPMEEVLSGSVDLPIDTETVQLIIKYIYSGQNVVTKGSVTRLYDAANYLQITTLVEDCEHFLKKDISEEICLEIWIVSKKFNNMEVAEISRSMVLQGFSLFCTYDYMDMTPLEDLIDLLKDPYLNCTGHLKCRAAWLWFMAHDDTEDKKIESLVQALVSAKNVDNTDILEACNTEESPLDVQVDTDLLQTTWKRICKKLWISVEDVPYSTTGANYDKEECLAILVCDKSGKNILLAFDFKKKKWYDLKVSEKDLGHRYAICSRDSLLYVSGGTRKPKSLQVFNGGDKQWYNNHQVMPVGREQHVMHNLDKKIFVLGGFSNDVKKLWEVHVYDCENDTWSVCGQVACPVVAPCSVQIETNIVLLGGSVSGERAASDTLQYYNTYTNVGSFLEVKLPFKAKSHTMSVTNFNSGIYIVHDAQVYYLEPHVRKPREKIQKNLPGVQNVGSQIEKICKLDIEVPPLKGFAVTSFGSKILIIGGEDKTFETRKSIIQYDVVLKQSVLLSVSTPLPMKDMHFTKLSVPQSWDVTDFE